MQLILEPGFSTADRLTQQAGPRRRHGRRRHRGQEARRRPLHRVRRRARARASRSGCRSRSRSRRRSIVRVHDEFYALPVRDGRGRCAPAARRRCACTSTEEQPTFEYGGHVYRFQHLGAFLGSGPSALPETGRAVPVVLVRAGEHSTALVTDELMGSREIVVKSVGPQVASVRGISGATILGDGRIVIILDMGALVRSEWRSRAADVSVRPTRDDRIFAHGRGRLDHGAPRDAAPARAQRHARAHGEGRRRRDGAAAGAHARRHPARHRDAAHGRLRGRRARAQRPAARATCRSS